MDHGTRVAKDLVIAYGRKCTSVSQHPAARDSTIDLGLRLGKLQSK